MEQINLTQFSPGAGCGCKISPKDLEQILKKETAEIMSPNLLVGNETSDDAAVYKLTNDIAIISTTDFFTPIVDDPYDFGRIAATNAISDVYAMGGKPVLAIAILGWPLEKLSAEIASRVIEGARFVCKQSGIALAGGHSIDIQDPIFGLAVNGVIHPEKIKMNSTATKGCQLFLTKPIGIGLCTTAEKRGIVSDFHKKTAVELMTKLNSIGALYGTLDYVKAITDVTGFGLLGHLLEMCQGSNLKAVIEYQKIPVINGIEHYIENKAIPGGTYRNWKSYGHKVKLPDEKLKFTLCDPQTSGGLLVAVEENHISDFIELSRKEGYELSPIGFLEEKKSDYWIEVV